MQFQISVIITLIACLVILLAVIVISMISVTFGGSFRKSFRKGSWALLVPVIAMLFGHFFGTNVFQVKKYEISSETLPREFDSYRIVHISDIHLHSFRHRESSLRRAVRKVNSQNPDLIVFTGDIVSFQSAEFDGFTDILEGLKAKDGVYAVMGNHDYCSYAFRSDEEAKAADEMKLRCTIREMGWNLLEDSWAQIEREGAYISLIGGENGDEVFQNRQHLDTALKDCPDGFRILLFHDPSVWRNQIVGNIDIDLTLSGHTHALQFSIFGWCPSSYLFQDYRGRYDENGQTLIVNAGLGETGVPARIGAWPEIGVITLHSGD